jgi:hypothetical protein
MKPEMKDGRHKYIFFREYQNQILEEHNAASILVRRDMIDFRHRRSGRAREMLTFG